MATIDVLDKETFARVWQRVQPEGGPIIPAGLLPPGTPSETGTEQRQISDFPLGNAAAGSVPFLRRQIEMELRCGASARFLVNQMGGSAALVHLGERCLRRAKRLAAALLLISGVWYLPRAQSTPRRWPDWRGGLRGLFVTFQCQERDYLIAAKGVSDPELQRLFQELGEESRQMQETVRRVLER